MSYWKCTETVITDDGSEAFTEGRLYAGLSYAEEVNAGTERAYTRKAGVSFKNNQGNTHLAPSRWLNKYFVKVDKE